LHLPQTLPEFRTP